MIVKKAVVRENECKCYIFKNDGKNDEKIRDLPILQWIKHDIYIEFVFSVDEIFQLEFFCLIDVNFNKLWHFNLNFYSVINFNVLDKKKRETS